jgi:dienelactone hydrolase
MNNEGDKIAYLSKKGDGIELKIEDFSGKLIRKFDLEQSRGLYAFGITWAHTGKHILIHQDTNGDENCHVHCLDIATGQSKDLTPFKEAKSVLKKLSRKYPNEILVTSNDRNPKWLDVYRINIITGEAKKIFKNDAYAKFLYDHNFDLRLAGKILSDGSEDWYQIIDGKYHLFKKIAFEDVIANVAEYEDLSLSAFLGFDADCKILYGLDVIGRDKQALVAYNLQEKTSQTVFENDLADADVFSWDPNTFRPQIAVVDYLKPDIYLLDRAISEDIEYIKAHFGDSDFVIMKRNTLDDTWLLMSTSSVSSAKFYLYKRDAKNHKPISIKFLFSMLPELDKYHLQKMVPIKIKSRDGLDLICYLTKSVDFKKGIPSKLILDIHGGPMSRDHRCLNLETQLFANRGYSVMQINYRGSTGFGKSFQKAGNRSLEKIRDDIIDCVNWAVENGIADKNQIAITGVSFGGHFVLAALAFSPDVFCCGVDVVGPSNLITTLSTFPQYWGPKLIEWYKLLGDPRTEEGRRYLIANSPITKVRAIKKPLIIFQGKNDPRIKQSEADQIVAAMKKRNLSVVYVLYPDEGHGFLKEQNNRSYIIITELFLAKIMVGRCEPIHPGELEGSSHQILEGKELLGL